jgi:hypothetical protein
MYLQKKVKTLGILSATDEKSRIWIRKLVVQYGSADPNPYQNVSDPQHMYRYLYWYDRIFILKNVALLYL